MAIYARITEGPDPRRDSALLVDLLKRLHCDRVLLLPRLLGATLGASTAEKADASVTTGPAEAREDAQTTASTLRVTLVRSDGPGLKSLFPDTPIVGPKTWAPMQQRRGASHLISARCPAH